MKYISHFIRYSLMFFVIFGLFYSVIFFLSEGFDFHKVFNDSLASNIIRIVCSSVISAGCGYYIASFLIFHNNALSGVFLSSNVFVLLALKADSTNLVVRRIGTFCHIPPFVMMCILFGISLALLTVTVIAQARHNLMIIRSADPADSSHETALFM